MTTSNNYRNGILLPPHRRYLSGSTYWLRETQATTQTDRTQDIKTTKMKNQFSQKVSEIISHSRDEARRLSCSTIAPEHLLLGIMKDDNSPIYTLFYDKKVRKESVQDELEERLKSNTPSTQSTTADEQGIPLNEKASNILRLAVLEARLQHSEQVEPEHLILAILHDNVNNGAKEILLFNNINYEDTLNCFKHNTSTTKDGLYIPEEENDTTDDRQPGTSNVSHDPAAQGQASQTPILDKFSTDLTRAAAEGKLDKVVGRTNETQRVIEILSRRKKNNPILIGEPGVGKSAIVEGLAQMIADRHISPIFFKKRIVSLNMTAIVAGTKYRGQFEERIQALLKEIESTPDIIVFIDEIHTLIGAGSTPGSMDAANIMKPALARGKFQCIGATTLDEYRNSIEKDGALERRFQKVLVAPTTEDETLEILNNIKDRYEAFHHVAYTDDAVKACIKLTERYVNERFFPDKAIDALDEAGAKVHLRHADVPDSITMKEKEIEAVKQEKNEAVANQDYEKAAAYRDKQTKLQDELKALNEAWLNDTSSERETVCEGDIADVVSIMSGVPVQRIAESEGIRLKNMSSDLRKAIIGQDKAIDKVVRSIQRNRIGMKDPNKPIGVFMFLGPTGVGKTYLTKKLAEAMFGSEDSLIRIDMSEYSEKFNTSRLIGAPPGYVGYDEGGQLTEKVRRHPYSIVLLDEIEKANDSVFNLLLQVFDEGRLTDGNGRLVDFRNTIVIMTSNTGTKQLKDFGRGIGFNASGYGSGNIGEQDKEYARSIIQKSLRNQFSPEFLNRLDDIVMFDQLDRASIDKIAALETGKLAKRIADLGYDIHIDADVNSLIADKGYDVQFGARPLKRAIQTYIEDGVCELILSEGLSTGDGIHVGLSADGKNVRISKADSQPPAQTTATDDDATSATTAQP